jgi:mRNA interferase HicA
VYLHKNVYNQRVKRRDLEKKLKQLGWWKIDGSKHDKWTNGRDCIAVPRHSEINEFTARGIIREAENYNEVKGEGEKK